MGISLVAWVQSNRAQQAEETAVEERDRAVEAEQ